MRIKLLLLTMCIGVMNLSCTLEKSMEILSPDGKLKYSLQINREGNLFYELLLDQKELINKSELGLDLKSDELFFRN